MEIYASTPDNKQKEKNIITAILKDNNYPPNLINSQPKSLQTPPSPAAKENGLPSPIQSHKLGR